MKKTLTWTLLGIVMSAVALVGCGTTSSSSASSEETFDWQFAVGTDAVTAEGAGTTEWSPSFTINLKVVGGAQEDLFSGTVTLKSDTMWASEFLKAAVTDKGIAQDGIDVGFVTTLGDYANNAEESMYWMYTINGASPSFGCNQYQLRDGDFMLWTYAVVDWTATPVVPERPTGDWAFTVGSDTVTGEGAGTTEWSPTFTINLKIVGGASDELFNGTVTFKSDTMMASEFLKAAVTDKGIAQEGIDIGFVTTMGDYANNAEESMYWLYTINGVSPSFGCNGYQLRTGDYMLWTYGVVTF